MKILAQFWNRFWNAGLILALILSFYPLTTTPVLADTPDWENYTYQLVQSTASIKIWTTPPSEHVFGNSVLPAETGAEIKVYAARSEFEPFQVIIRPRNSGTVAVQMGSFGSGITTELYQVKTVQITEATDYLGQTGLNPDPLWPIANGAAISVAANQNTAFWISVFVPKTTPPGEYLANFSIGGIHVPVRLHVFNFTIPDEMHVQSQMNFSYQTILTRYGVSGTGTEYWDYVQRINQMMVDHRLTPAGPLWPGGVTTNGASPFIDYDCNGVITDNDGIWGFEIPAEHYLQGTMLRNLTGYPSFMAAGFRNNDPSIDQRPDTFCGRNRSASDWLANPTSSYNVKWTQYITALQNYLSGLGYLDQAYYYIGNEPQDQADYDAMAWYSKLLKAVAPGLKLMVSEEPKPEIYANPTYPGAKIDIWLAHLGMHFNPEASLERLKNNNEETWIYFLYNTYLPRFNPFTIDHPGEEARFTGWYLWKYRLRGLAYYRFNDWSSNPWTNPMDNGQNGEYFMLYPPSTSNTNIAYGSNGHRFVPSIRLELLRDGLEDYEYFYLLNGGQQPEADVISPADEWVDRIINGTVVYNRDSEMIYNIRRLVGLKIGGELADIPEIEPESTHPRSDGVPGNYYLNFQDPAGQPTGTVTYDGHTYEKIGNNLYDPSLGYGWYRAADVPQADFYTFYDPWFDVQPTALLRSMVINDWGREDVFEYDLPNGVYRVTVGVGYRGGTRHHKIVIEDEVLIDNETTNNSAIIRSGTVTVRDKKLSLTMGMYDEVSFLNFLEIEAASPAVTNLRVAQATLNAGELTVTLNWTPPYGAVGGVLKMSTDHIRGTNWNAAQTLTDDFPITTGTYTFTIPYSSGPVYFAVKNQNAGGDWSVVSNNAFWPQFLVNLPLISK